MLKYLTTDSRSFKDLIEGGYLYIDKTGYFYEMLKKGSPSKYWFLSRPRRFGKSLTIDTLANIFSGNKEFFKGTYIYDRYDFESYPVIRFSMNNLRADNYENNVKFLLRDVYGKAESFGVAERIDTTLDEPYYYFSELLRGVREKTGKQAVVLIDEYDYPLMQVAHQKKEFDRMRDMLSSFYETLKVEEESLRFCFITGITRFSQVSIFSKLNNLLDISNDPVYASVCGYTDEELDKYFTPYMEKYYEENGVEGKDREDFRRRIKEYYDGYRFSIRNEVTVYNPVSIGKFFIGGCSFENFWISTGAQSIVDRIITDHPELFRAGTGFSMFPESMSTFQVEDVFSSTPEREAVYSYLVQAGYMTLKGERNGQYLLDYPNKEVRDTMNAKVLSTYGLRVRSSSLMLLRESFSREDTESVMSIFHDAYVNIPYDMFMEKENNYQIAFYTALMFLGFDEVRAEERTNMGRIDIAVRVRKGLVYIIELKLDESGDKALSQIKEKRYYEKYTSEGCRVHLLGINFSSKERNISDWKEEIIS